MLNREDLVLRLAKAMNGPFQPVPEGCRFTLEQLREVRWSQLSANEAQHFKQAARSALAEMETLGIMKTLGVVVA